jgi:hypothetical protein
MINKHQLLTAGISGKMLNLNLEKNCQHKKIKTNSLQRSTLLNQMQHTLYPCVWLYKLHNYIILSIQVAKFNTTGFKCKKVWNLFILPTVLFD